MKLNPWAVLLVIAMVVLVAEKFEGPIASATGVASGVLRAVMTNSDDEARSILESAVGLDGSIRASVLSSTALCLRSARRALLAIPVLANVVSSFNAMEFSPATRFCIITAVALLHASILLKLALFLLSPLDIKSDFPSTVSRKQAAPAYPTGWFAVSMADQLKKKDVRPVVVCGQHIVLFRGEDGKAAVLDAYCPHLGAHLAVGGIVKGNDIVCPFHGWEFRGSDGVCTAIPYCDNVPTYTKTNAWPTVEKNGFIYVWHDVDGQKPNGQPPPSGADSSLAMKHGRFQLSVAASVQEMREGLASLTSPQKVSLTRWLPGLVGSFSSTWSPSEPSETSQLTVTQKCTWFGMPCPLFDITFRGTFCGPSILVINASTYFGSVNLVDTVTPNQSMQQTCTTLCTAQLPVPRFIAKLALSGWSALSDHIAAQWTHQSRATVPNPMRGSTDSPVSTVAAFRQWMDSFAPKSGKKKKEGMDW